MASLESRVRTLELEVGDLKRLLEPESKRKSRVRIKGLLQGANFGGKDVREAKRSLFPATRYKRSN